MKELKLSNSDLCVLLDDEDYERLSKYRWYINDRNSSISRNATSTKGKKIRISMAREVMNDLLNPQDHINHNILDNQKSNLRPTTNSLNCGHRRKQNGIYSSKYKGVSFDKKRNLWRAGIRILGQMKWLGHFLDEILAAKEYNKAAIKYFGEFAHTNQFTESIGN